MGEGQKGGTRIDKINDKMEKRTTKQKANKISAGRMLLPTRLHQDEHLTDPARLPLSALTQPTRKAEERVVRRIEGPFEQALPRSRHCNRAPQLILRVTCTKCI